MGIDETNTAMAAAIALADKANAAMVTMANAKAATDISAAILTNDIAYIKNDMREIKKSIETIKDEIKDDFVTRRELVESLKSIEDQIKPIKTIIWGLVGTILLAVIGAILKGLVL